MRQRLLFTGTMLIALFTSAWGSVFAAAFCPHLKLGHACCRTRRGHDQSAHAMAGEMQMGDTQVLPAADPASEGDAISQPVEPCEHCMGRSQAPAVSFALIEVSQTRHGEDAPPPAISSRLAPSSTSFTAHVTSRQHAPPGSSITRHVLINVFRI
jgi:hypothetical protein